MKIYLAGHSVDTKTDEYCLGVTSRLLSYYHILDGLGKSCGHLF